MWTSVLYTIDWLVIQLYPNLCNAANIPQDVRILLCWETYFGKIAWLFGLSHFRITLFSDIFLENAYDDAWYGDRPG